MWWFLAAMIVIAVICHFAWNAIREAFEAVDGSFLGGADLLDLDDEARAEITEADRLDIAADIHLIARERLTEIGGKEPSIEEVASVMACAFGDTCGLLMIEGKGAQIPALNALAERSAEAIMGAVQKATGQGDA